MNKRFILTAAGVAATGLVAGSASAEVVDFTHSADYWNGEHSWEVVSSGGLTVASMYVASSYIWYAGIESDTYLWTNGSYPSGQTVTGTMDLASGTYQVNMHDAYGDGWQTGSFVGSLAIGSGSASFSAGAGYSTGFSFNVAAIPAPGALALLGLAGLASRRRK